jgi:ABC-type branched-subunit amino acid transport system substrate-binding protein
VLGEVHIVAQKRGETHVNLHTRFPRLLCLASTLAVCLVAAGCGGSGGGKATLQIINFDPFSGPNADYGNLLYAGCVPAVRLINQQGGVLGHKLKCTVVDNRGDPADAVLAARKMLATTSHRVGIIESDSGLLAATVPLFNAAKVTDLSGAGDVSFDKAHYQYFWRTIPGDDVNGYAAAAYAKQAGYSRIASVFGNDVASQGNVPGLLSGSKNLGLDVVLNESLALDKTSYDIEVHKILSSHPQAIVTESDPQTSAVFLGDLKKAGGLMPIIGTSGTIDPSWDRAVTAAIGPSDFAKYFKIDTLESPSSGSTWQTYSKALLASAKTVPRASQYTTQVYSESAYDDVNLEALAMVAAKSTNAADYNRFVPLVTQGKTVVDDYRSGVNALRSGQSIKYVGVTGQMKFDQYHNSPGVFAVMVPGAKNKVVAVITPSQVAAAEGR